MTSPRQRLHLLSIFFPPEQTFVQIDASVLPNRGTVVQGDAQTAEQLGSGWKNIPGGD